MPLLSRLLLCLFLAAALTVLRPVGAQTPPPPSSQLPPYQGPKPLERPPISYPELAKLNRVTGLLRVLLTVDETGHVTNVELITGSGSLMLDQVVLSPILKSWTFRPATIGGKPVTGTYEQELEFKLDPEEQRALTLRRSALTPAAGTPDPPYPEAARAKTLRGRAVVAVTWTDNGLVEGINLQQSSGSALLDVTALRWAYDHWRVDRAQFKEPQFVKTVVFDPERPDRAAELTNATPPPLGTPPPAATATPTPAASPRKR